MKKINKATLRDIAQDAVAHAVANVRGYYDPINYGWTLPEEQKAEFARILEEEADKAVRALGFDESWIN